VGESGSGAGTLQNSRGTGKEENVGAGEVRRRFRLPGKRERERAVRGEEGDGADKVAPPVGGRERGGEGGSRLGHGLGRGEGALGFWAKKAERGKENGEIPASFYFLYQISK